MNKLTMLKDGVDGTDLGIIEHSQYTLTPKGDIMRRKASEAGSYGGWRWEMTLEHASHFPIIHMQVLTAINQALLCEWDELGKLAPSLQDD